MMPCGLNAHPQDFANVARDIAMMMRLGPTFVRVSALQHGVINQERATSVKRMVDAGLKVVGLCTSESCATMGDAAWKSYCQNYAKASRWCGVMHDQVGNEWNTQPFWGGPPDTRKAYRRFGVAQDIIGRPCIAGGVTCENKNASNKISAVRWIASWLADGANPLAWDLHWYHTDVKQKAVYEQCVKLLKGKIVTVLETGCSDVAQQLAWYRGIKKGVWGALPARVLWYSYNDNGMPQFALVDRNSKPGALAKAILGGADEGDSYKMIALIAEKRKAPSKTRKGLGAECER
jgi:hypothetical protein